MQLVGGSKQICEMIMYFGKWSITAFERLKAHSAPQPTDFLYEREENEQLKDQAHLAKFNFRYAKSLSKGNKRTLPDEDTALLKLYTDGTLLTRANDAVRNYGHGTLHDPRSSATLAIGGSTGGVTRICHDGWQDPNDDAH